MVKHTGGSGLAVEGFIFWLRLLERLHAVKSCLLSYFTMTAK